MDTQSIFDLLTKQLGYFFKEVTQRKVLLGVEGQWNRPDRDFLLIDLQAMESFRWETGQGTDEQGNPLYAHNFLVTYLVTAFRGNTHTDLSKSLQKFKTPHIYYKYFPTGSPFSFSSSSSVSRTRVPIEDQKFENQSSVILNFNVCFTEGDFDFENLYDVNITGIVHPPGMQDIQFDVEVKLPDGESSSEIYELINDEMPVYGSSTWINTNN